MLLLLTLKLKGVKIRPLMDGNLVAFIRLDNAPLVKIRPLMDGNFNLGDIVFINSKS